MKYFKKLVGEKIYLSPMNLEDAEIFTKWLNDFNVSDYTGRSSGLMTVNAEKEWLNNALNSGESLFSIIKLENDKLIGNTGLMKIDNIRRTATLGIMIGESENMNKGYGTEALKLLLDYGFNYLNLNNIMLEVFEFNKRAIRAYQKAGFKEIGRRRKAYFLNGKYYDEIYMDILAEEFTESYIKNKNIEIKANILYKEEIKMCCCLNRISIIK